MFGLDPIAGALVALLGILAVGFIIWAVLGAFATSVSERLARLFPARQPGASSDNEGRKDSMPTFTRILSGRRFTEKLYVELSSAGWMIRPSEFVGLVAACVIGSQFIAAIVVKGILGHLAFALVAAAIPIIMLKSMQQKRRMAFHSQIVDALIMIASSLRAGFSFMRAMQMVAQEMPPPISEEFRRVVDEVNVGRSMEEALRSVIARVNSYDFDLVVTAVLIHLQVGGNLAEILDTIAETIRERVRVMGEMKALTAEGRISGVVMVALPLVMAAVISIINPPYIHVLISESIGHYLIIGAVTCQIIGALIIRRILVLDI